MELTLKQTFSDEVKFYIPITRSHAKGDPLGVVTAPDGPALIVYDAVLLQVRKFRTEFADRLGDIERWRSQRGAGMTTGGGRLNGRAPGRNPGVMASQAGSIPARRTI